MAGIIVKGAGIEQATVGRDGATVLLRIGGRTYQMPWEAADQIARALQGKARDAEEQAKAPQIAMDAAILLRAGVPIGLSSDARIRDEAGKLAAWDSELRRYMPGGVKSEEMLGRPSVTVHGRTP